MVDVVEFTEKPKSADMVMIAGWRQWADAGSVSSGLPKYLIQNTNARRIGKLKPDGFYFFQIPGTHDLVRPVIKFNHGYPRALETPHNEFYFTGNDDHGVVIFLGDEPHMDVERYTLALLEAADALGVRRIVSLGGVYGELPYHKERSISCIYSMRSLRDEFKRMAVTLSEYQGGASIDSFLCKRAGERGKEHIGFYAFVPAYDLSQFGQVGNGMRIETDFMAWLGVMRRVNYMLKTSFDLSDLEDKSRQLVDVMDAKVEELEQSNPDADVRDYFDRLSDEFTEMIFNPLDDVWEEELRRILDDDDLPDGEDAQP